MHYRTALHRRFGEGDARYVYVTPSAAVMRLDEVSEALFEAFSCPGGADPEGFFADLGPEDEVGDLRTTFEEMVALGMIRPVDEVLPPVPTAPPADYPLATLVLNVTNKCNLSCTYCYEYGEDKLEGTSAAAGPKRRAMMPPDTARESIDFLFGQIGDRRKVTITFFGGETLLNFGTVRAATAYALEKAAEAGVRVDFSLTTNATLLTEEVVEFLVAHGFGVNVSIDGDRRAHDRHRRFRSGRGSYDLVLPQIRRLLERNRGRGRPIGARVTVTAGATDLGALYRHLTEEVGFDDVGFAPVTSAPDRDYALSGADYEALLREFRALADDFVERAAAGERHGFSNLADLLREIHLGNNKAHPCGAGLGLLGVSTEGDLGLCHRFVESGDHEIGSVRDGIDETARRDFLERAHVENKPDCMSCFARPVCAGGCYHEAQVRYGDASRANLHYCDWIRSWMDLGLETYARIQARNPDYFEAYERV